MGLCNYHEYTAAVDSLALLMREKPCRTATEANAEEPTAAVYPWMVACTQGGPWM